MHAYLANHLCSNFCLNPEIQLRGGSGGISALGRIFQFGQIFRNLRRAIPILRGARAVNCGKTSQFAKPKRFEEFGRKKPDFRRKKPDSGGKSRIRADFPRNLRGLRAEKHGFDTGRGGFGGFFCRVLVLSELGVGRILEPRADFLRSGGFFD